MRNMEEDPLLNSVAQGVCDSESSALRRRLLWHQYSVYAKARSNKRHLLKMFAQVLKTLLVTAQAVYLMRYDYNLYTFNSEVEGDLHQKFVYSDGDDEPPALYSSAQYHEYIRAIYGQYELFTKNFFYRFPTSGISTNSFDYRLDLYCPPNCSRHQEDHPERKWFRIKDLKELNDSLSYQIKLDRLCYIFESGVEINYNSGCVSSPRFARSKNVFIMIKYTFDDKQHSGIITPLLDIDVKTSVCGNRPPILSSIRKALPFFATILAFLVVSCISFVLTTRSLIRERRLYVLCRNYFLTRRNVVLSSAEKREFFSFWLATFFINDILSVISCSCSAIIIMTGTHFFFLHFIVGIDAVLIWVGSLKYLEHIKSFNDLILVIRNGSAAASRFMFCAIILYVGFCLCAYCTISPYHEKFSDYLKISATLFGLMNGDEVYSTYQMIPDENPIIAYFFKIYLSIYIFIFMYFVISVLISILTEANEITESDRPKTTLSAFVDECSCDNCTLQYDTYPVLPS